MNGQTLKRQKDKKNKVANLGAPKRNGTFHSQRQVKPKPEFYPLIKDQLIRPKRRHTISFGFDSSKSLAGTGGSLN
jgi:hypothetical protein